MATAGGIWSTPPIPSSACGWITASSSHPTTRRGSSAFGPHADGEEEYMIDRLRYRFLRLLISCMLVLAVPAAVAAQDSTPTTPDLIVTVRDVSGAALPNLMVQIHAGADTPMLVQART